MPGGPEGRAFIGRCLGTPVQFGAARWASATCPDEGAVPPRRRADGAADHRIHGHGGVRDHHPAHPVLGRALRRRARHGHPPVRDLLGLRARVLVSVGLGERQMGAQAGPAGEPHGLGAVVPVARLRRSAVDAVRRAGDRRDLRRQRRGGAGLYRRRDDGEEPRPGGSACSAPPSGSASCWVRRSAASWPAPTPPIRTSAPLHGGGGNVLRRRRVRPPVPPRAGTPGALRHPLQRPGPARGLRENSRHARRRSSAALFRHARLRHGRARIHLRHLGRAGRSVGARARPGSSSPISGCC